MKAPVEVSVFQKLLFGSRIDARPDVDDVDDVDEFEPAGEARLCNAFGTAVLKCDNVVWWFPTEVPVAAATAAA